MEHYPNDLTMVIIDPLYCYYDPCNKQPALYSKTLAEGHQLTVRPFYIPADISCLLKWIKNKQSNRYKERDNLKEGLITMQEEFAEDISKGSFTGCIDNLPTWKTDITRAGDSAAYRKLVTISPGDVFIRLELSPAVNTDSKISRQVIRFNLSWLFSYPQVKQVFAVVPEEDSRLIECLLQLRFSELYTLEEEHYKIIVFRITARQFNNGLA